ncbi:hypothetical protein BJV77DRAFT_157302 [Russula vinacea]|nr:hypothetical protein BJV77DRAFT_157302 [Russula vinacea]
MGTMHTRVQGGRTFERGLARAMTNRRAAMGGTGGCFELMIMYYRLCYVFQGYSGQRTAVDRHRVIFMSVPTTVPSPPRSARPLAARKQQNDPVWSSTNPSSVTSAKRQAVERVEGEPRNKRKRVEPTLQPFSQQLGHRADKLQERQMTNHLWGLMMLILRQMDFSRCR